MQKVKLPREVAEDLDQIKRNIDYPICAVVETFNGIVIFDYTALNEYFEQDRSRRIETIMQALVNGYEIEETPEEQAIQWMIKKKCLSPGFSEHDIVMAIKSILQRGMNDHE